MKILHITTELTGGAGLGALRLHRDLLDSGIDSTILALSGESNDPRIVSLLNPGQHRKRRWRDIPSFALHRIGMHDSPYYRAQKSLTPFRKLTEAYVSTPFTRFDLLRHPLVQATDIVHLHWVANFLDWPSFFPKIRKPIVWTLRDENPALGFWHFRSDMPDPLPDSIRREDDWLRRMKERIVGNCRSLGIVSLSSAEDAFFADSNAFFGRPHAVVPNSIDASRFLPEAKQTIRKEIGLGDNGIILAFVAHNIGERRKGLGDLFEAVALTGRKNITILCAGAGKPPPIPEGIRFVSIGLVNDATRLARLLSAANLFVTPSYAETFGKTTTEALACGIPVVSYPNSGAKDIIEQEDGVLAKDFSPEALANAIQQALARTFNSSILRERVIARFSRERVVKSYVEIYKNSMP